MKETTKDNQVLQWHPAFYASLQIEFAEEADKLIFENEHQLGTKPKEIDVLIIKKNSKDRIQKNIGRIFRTHNIIEYKSPNDYLSVDDFYKVYGYACFYKADTPREGTIPPEEITISFVSRNYPDKMMKHLQEVRHMDIMEGEQGIYYIDNDIFQIQLIVTSELPEELNLWLRNLTNDLADSKTIERLLHEYKYHTHESNYKSAMNIIINANMQVFKEVGKMCDALMELMKDELEAKKAQGIEQGIEQRIEQSVSALIEAYQELQLSENEMLMKLTQKLKITEATAKEYLAKYL